MQRIFYISSDHGGFKLKEEIKGLFVKTGLELIDLGPFEYDEWDDYPDFASILAEKVQADKQARGIVICTNGVGVAVVTNKYKGVRTGLCHNEEHVESAVQDDNINVLSLPASYITNETAIKIVEKFVDTDFSEQERHIRRLDKLTEIEEKNFK